MKTRITDLLGIEFPILQGGMAWVADGHLAAAVSAGGGLGIIGAATAPKEWVREQIRLVRSKTDKPFGVNIMLMSPTAKDIAELMIEEKVPVVTTGAGNPSPFIPAWKEAGIRVIPVVPSTALAVRMERMGADAVVAEGGESGGHVGELSTMALLPQVVDAVQIPVIGAGGIADGRGFAAVLMLGASAVQVGTRFVCCTECTAHEQYKQKIVGAKDSDSRVTGRPTGHPVRVLRNRLARQFQDLESSGASVEEIEKLGEGKLRAAVVDGDVEYGSVMAGQIAGMICDIRPAADILRGMNADAEALLAGGWKESVS